MMIIGNLGADPELRYTPGGKAVANLRVAVNDRHRGPDGEWVEDTQWFRVELWDQAAERAAERFRKGNKVFAEGQLRVREYEGNDGQKRSSVEIRFARVISLERREPGEAFGIGDAASDAPPAAVPRGAAATSTDSPAEMVELDDIPF
jgi:single-strand DNA-binding protein